MRFWPSRSQWRAWSLPSKLTAIGTLVGVLSLGLYFVEKASGLSNLIGRRPMPSTTLPKLLLQLTNSSGESVALERRGDFILWLPRGVSDGAPSLPGKYELSAGSDAQLPSDFLEVPASSSLNASASLANGTRLSPILEAGDTDLELIIRPRSGGMVYSGSIPFTDKALKTTRWRVEVIKQ